MGQVKQVEDHQNEDVFGLEIYPGDVYWMFGKDVVNDRNLRTYLIEKQDVKCYRAIENENPPAATDGDKFHRSYLQFLSNPIKNQLKDSKMHYFESKDRKIFSSKDIRLKPFYKLLEHYHVAIGGTNLFDDLAEIYDYLDFVIKEKEE